VTLCMDGVVCCSSVDLSSFSPVHFGENKCSFSVKNEYNGRYMNFSNSSSVNEADVTDVHWPTCTDWLQPSPTESDYAEHVHNNKQSRTAL